MKPLTLQQWLDQHLQGEMLECHPNEIAWAAGAALSRTFTQQEVTELIGPQLIARRTLAAADRRLAERRRDQRAELFCGGGSA